MKKVIIYLVIILVSPTIYGQSSIVYGVNTSIYLGEGADLCAATITINGAFSGGGTFCNQPVSIETESDPEMLIEYFLFQNYPNPFNPICKIDFGIQQESKTTLVVYDIIGNLVKIILGNEFLPAGRYSYYFDAAELPSGVYFYQLRAGDFLETKKMILLK